MIRVLAIAVLLAATVPAHAQQADPVVEAAARVTLDEFAACVARTHPDESLRVLSADFRTAAYRNGLRLLVREAQGNCTEDVVGDGNSMRSASLLMAGAIAENLIEAQAGPINQRLLRAAGSAAETYSPTDALAQCLARSLPDETGALFATTPGEDAEQAAAAPLLAAIEPCAQATSLTAAFDLSVSALRAMLATSALRLVVASAAAE